MRGIKWMMATALAATLIAGVAEAQGKAAMPGSGDCPGMMGGAYGHGWGMGHGMMGGMMEGGCPMMGLGPLWDLNLTPDQKKKLDALMAQQREQHWSIMRAMSENRQKLHQLYSAEPLDAAAIDKVYEEIFRNQRAMIASGIRMRNQVYALLTPEQKNQLKRHAPGWGGGPGPGPR